MAANFAFKEVNGNKIYSGWDGCQGLMFGFEHWTARNCKQDDVGKIAPLIPVLLLKLFEIALGIPVPV